MIVFLVFKHQFCCIFFLACVKYCILNVCFARLLYVAVIGPIYNDLFTHFFNEFNHFSQAARSVFLEDRIERRVACMSIFRRSMDFEKDLRLQTRKTEISCKQGLYHLVSSVSCALMRWQMAGQSFRLSDVDNSSPSPSHFLANHLASEMKRLQVNIHSLSS